MKKVFLLLLLLATIVFAGCSKVRESRKNLAAAAAEAIIEGEAEELWETFAPEMRKLLVEKFGRDEDETCKAALEAVRKKAAEKYQISDWDKAEDDEKLLKRIADDLLADGKMKKIDGEWYFDIL